MDIETIQQRIKQADKLHISETDQTDRTVLAMSDYTGIIEYHPEELVLTVKAGTCIAEIAQVLAQHSQTLPFSTDMITIGGAYATGSPELRDAVLGVNIVDGMGRNLTFGGQVMKNVAGYDVARLLVGSHGKLAVICTISFKVLPQAYCQYQTKKMTHITTTHSPAKTKIEQGLKTIFDPYGIFI